MAEEFTSLTKNISRSVGEIRKAMPALMYAADAIRAFTNFRPPAPRVGEKPERRSSGSLGALQAPGPRLVSARSCGAWSLRYNSRFYHSTRVSE